MAAKQAQEEQTQQRYRERRARQKERRAREEEEEAQCEVGECCDAPDFDFSQPPAGMTTFPDGDVAAVARSRRGRTASPRVPSRRSSATRTPTRSTTTRRRDVVGGS